MRLRTLLALLLAGFRGAALGRRDPRDIPFGPALIAQPGAWSADNSTLTVFSNRAKPTEDIDLDR